MGWWAIKDAVGACRHPIDFVIDAVDPEDGILIGIKGDAFRVFAVKFIRMEERCDDVVCCPEDRIKARIDLEEIFGHIVRNKEVAGGGVVHNTGGFVDGWQRIPRVKLYATTRCFEEVGAVIDAHLVDLRVAKDEAICI